MQILPTFYEWKYESEEKDQETDEKDPYHKARYVLDRADCKDCGLPGKEWQHGVFNKIIGFNPQTCRQ
jgi:hypothetical protein